MQPSNPLKPEPFTSEPPKRGYCGTCGASFPAADNSHVPIPDFLKYPDGAASEADAEPGTEFGEPNPSPRLLPTPTQRHP